MEAVAYANTAAHEASHWWFRSRRRLVLEQVAAAAREVGGGGRRPEILDYGCGTGFNLSYLSAFGSVTGADFFDGALAALWAGDGHRRLDLSKDDPRAHYGRYGIVTALDVLEHLDDDVEGLRRLRAFLGPSGQIVLTVPAYRWLWSGEDELSRHRRRYTAKDLVERAAVAALTVDFISYFNLSILPGMAAVIGARRLWSKRWAEQGSVGEVPAPLNLVLAGLTSIEAELVGRELVRLPAGASLVCRLRPKGDV